MTSPNSAAGYDFPLASVVIVNYNGGARLLRCLESLNEVDYPALEVIVVDNGDDDGMIRNVVQRFPWVRLSRNGHNAGFASAANTGAKIARGKYVAFLNPDAHVNPDWLRRLVRCISDEKVGAVSSKLLMDSDSSRLNAAGGACDIFGLGWNRGIEEHDFHQYDNSRDCFYAVGCGMMVKRKLFLSLGGFDEDYFLYYDDLDFSWRLRLAGYLVTYEPNALVYHGWMGSTRNRKPMVLFLLTKNRIRTIIKNYSLRNVALSLLFLSVFHLPLMVWTLKRKKVMESIPLSSAWLWNLRKLRSSWQARQKVQALRLVPDAAIKKYMIAAPCGAWLCLGRIKHPFLRNGATAVSKSDSKKPVEVIA